MAGGDSGGRARPAPPRLRLRRAAGPPRSPPQSAEEAGRWFQQVRQQDRGPLFASGGEEAKQTWQSREWPQAVAEGRQGAAELPGGGCWLWKRTPGTRGLHQPPLLCLSLGGSVPQGQ